MNAAEEYMKSQAQFFKKPQQTDPLDEAFIRGAMRKGRKIENVNRLQVNTLSPNKEQYQLGLLEEQPINSKNRLPQKIPLKMNSKITVDLVVTALSRHSKNYISPGR